jgi:hypothetical protein
MIYRILHRKQKIEQHEPHKKGVSLGAQERWTVPVPPVAPVGITLVTNPMIHHVIVLCPSHTMTQISITLALSSLYIVRLTTCYFSLFLHWTFRPSPLQRRIQFGYWHNIFETHSSCILRMKKLAKRYVYSCVHMSYICTITH